MVEEIFDTKSQSIIWTKVWAHPVFNKFATTHLSKKWHKEGVTLLDHTMKMTELIGQQINKAEVDAEYYKVMLLGALFSHIGYVDNVFWNSEKEDWSVVDPYTKGEELTRFLLWKEDAQLRETVCYFVRNWGKPSTWSESTEGIREIITTSCDTIYPRFCTIENLIKIQICNYMCCTGDISQWEENLHFVYDLAAEMECLDKPYDKFNSEIEKYVYFNDSIETYPQEVKDTCEFEAFITIGAPSKFDTKSEFTENALKILHDVDNSMDIVDSVLECCEAKNNFVLDLLTIPEEGWDLLFSTIYLYKGKITFVYGSEKYLDYLSPNLSMSYIIAN